MTTLYGRRWTRGDLARRTGSPATMGGVRLVQYEDGAERLNRVLQFRTGSGLDFTVMIDRAFDVGEAHYKGVPLNWASPTGFRHPSLHETNDENGFGWLRSFTGLLGTCGLDHVFGPAEGSGAHFQYPGRDRLSYPLHGRIAFTPARLAGYGEQWLDDGRCLLWAEGVVRQSANFGENLCLYRRIEADLGGTQIRLSDRVVNEGYDATPHMLLYHVNFGFPLLDEGSTLHLPSAGICWASHADDPEPQGVGYASQVAPREGFREQVYEHRMAADAAGDVRLCLINRNLPDLDGLGVAMRYNRDQLPCFIEWQNLRAGSYALGLEPGTNHIGPRDAAERRGEVQVLGHGEERRYALVFDVMSGSRALDACCDAIAAVQTQPAEHPLCVAVPAEDLSVRRL